MTKETRTVIGASPFFAIDSALHIAGTGDWVLARAPYPVGGLFGTRLFADHWAAELWRWNMET